MKAIFNKEPQAGVKLFFLMSIAIAIMVVDVSKQNFSKLRLIGNSIIEPLFYSIEVPVNWYLKLEQYLSNQQKLIQINSELELENLKLAAKNQKMEALLFENSQLRTLLQSGVRSSDELISANILRVSTDPLVLQMLIDKGSDDGIKVGQAIVDAHGLVGIIKATNNHTSVVLLLTDATHAVPIENSRNGVRAIAIGTGNITELELQHVPHTFDFKEGDLLVTSGLGGKYPQGYPVGKVTKRNHEAGMPFSEIKVAPVAALDKTRQILIVNEQYRIKEW